MGILLSVAGCVFLVYYDAETSSGHSTVGHLFFFVNCLATSMYVILTKPLVKKYKPVSVTGWNYIIASVCMIITAAIFNTNGTLLDFIC